MKIFNLKYEFHKISCNYYQNDILMYAELNLQTAHPLVEKTPEQLIIDSIKKCE